uniref:Uncharacterized protein n=1 Tax=Heliothis virescens TaxID=7102 RepID=A0A2A4JYY4_HELVI
MKRSKSYTWLSGLLRARTAADDDEWGAGPWVRADLMHSDSSRTVSSEMPWIDAFAPRHATFWLRRGITSVQLVAAQGSRPHCYCILRYKPPVAAGHKLNVKVKGSLLVDLVLNKVVNGLRALNVKLIVRLFFFKVANKQM